MKKIMFLAVVVAGLLSFSQVNAQLGWSRVALSAGDTISTSTSKDTVQKIVSLSAGYSSVSFKVKYTKLSGTVALKAYIYPGDGTDYDASPSDSSAAFSNASGFIFFDKVAPLPRSHYRIEVRASDGANSTQGVKVEVFYLPKRYSN
jgi:hypothetical protein